jgi:hypothetical protein
VPGLFLLSFATMDPLPWRRLIAGLALAVAATASPATAVAHMGGEPFIHVPVDHIVPGESFPIVAADLGPDSLVTIELATDDGIVPLGTVTAGPDGHFETVLVLPATVPEGYMQISAQSDDGTYATVWVRVGSEAASATPPGSAGAGLPVDPSLLVLLGAAIVVVAAWLVRSRRRPSPGRPRS